MATGGHPQATPARHRTVVLRHTAPDGVWHLDWLIDRLAGRSEITTGEADCPDLMAFRVMVRPEDPMVRAFDAERAADHRALYLAHEGDIGGGRGEVRRVAEGWCAIDRIDAHGLDLILDCGGPARRIVGRWLGVSKEDGMGDWRFAAGDAPGR